MRLAAEAERLLLDDHAVIALYHYTSKHLVDPRLDGWIGNPLDRHPSRFLRWRDVESSPD
jgi:oligopeptide transport system substrate-binding protein